MEYETQGGAINMTKRIYSPNNEAITGWMYIMRNGSGLCGINEINGIDIQWVAYDRICQGLTGARRSGEE